MSGSAVAVNPEKVLHTHPEVNSFLYYCWSLAKDLAMPAYAMTKESVADVMADLNRQRSEIWRDLHQQQLAGEISGSKLDEGLLIPMQKAYQKVIAVYLQLP